MKTKLILTLVTLMQLSCDNKTYTQTDVESLNQQGRSLSLLIAEKQKQLQHLNTAVSVKNAELNAISKENPKYILKIQFSQSRFSLDISDHIKDSMNSGEFELPVDRDFYNSVNVGDKMVDNFRMGSFILRGSFSSWNFKIINKRIE
jgi:hypothetical protein